ncbi:diguanylate cyclase domain-containing protein [Leptolinea tardivitalis]|uniref:GGDEF domain-containing protein n=1 Tax=Leptolinea tardivitalis TaxID=229920 RepID=A0A0N8GMA2_9CHLR|nr:diguanylate cyclase [Leptolinea tardivitalis]KPL74730.1 hypothetical protein ADM99_01230 [Leptolinea tardivitalis]GAP22902.1 protein containing FOG: GGDEF domain [Leptolinea tardivitalis]
MKNTPSARTLILYPGLLCIWLALSCAALFYVDIQTAMSGTLVLATVAAASLSAMTAAIIWGMNIITVIVFGVMLYVLYGFNTTSLMVYITFLAGEIGTAVLAWNTGKQVLLSYRQVERDHVLIEEMRINDETTGLMRFNYARKALSNEISRSLRYGKKMSLLLIKTRGWDEMAETIGLEARESLLKDICEILFNNCRNVDTLFINIDKIGVILPETDYDGAEVIAKRLIDQVDKKIKKELQIGVVSFPEDSIIDEDLLLKAEAALQYAIKNNTVLTGYREISEYRDQVLESDKIETSFHEYERTNSQNTIRADETAIHFCGIHTLTDIEVLQRKLSCIPNIGNIRLVDFSDNEIVFAADKNRTNVIENITNKLDINNVAIEEIADGVVIKLDPSVSVE